MANPELLVQEKPQTRSDHLTRGIWPTEHFRKWSLPLVGLQTLPHNPNTVTENSSTSTQNQTLKTHYEHHRSWQPLHQITVFGVNTLRPCHQPPNLFSLCLFMVLWGLVPEVKNQGEQSLGRITSDAQEVEAKGSRVSSGPLASLSYRQTSRKVHWRG